MSEAHLIIEAAKFKSANELAKAAAIYAELLDQNFDDPNPDHLFLLADNLYKMAIQNNDLLMGGGDEESDEGSESDTNNGAGNIFQQHDEEEEEEEESDDDENTKPAMNPILYQFDQEEEDLSNGDSDYDESEHDDVVDVNDDESSDEEQEDDMPATAELQSFKEFLEGDLNANALDLLLRAHDLYLGSSIDHKELPEKRKLKIAELLSLTGDIYQEFEEFDMALKNYKYSLEFYEKCKDTTVQEIIKINWKIFGALKWLDNSEEDKMKQLKKVESIIKKHGNGPQAGLTEFLQLIEEEMNEIKADSEMKKTGPSNKRNPIQAGFDLPSNTTSGKVNDLSVLVKKKKSKNG
ncbi:hypothetical protein NCAS_0A06020 [Naumovozyma castellii]|uniref:Tetratricopeptide SHNi-TPR domain-containing protein n=1 Tax=Naumovozyma castellii TaxID=27288 RepID=G0V6R4_NAUCA|nr:hypothetical protein NCAS_0A06020 [Naumovozyma castellii CBS 4309]CCC67160.1 hypothetical protein NCAS_0A06020 [Naumovozyma castellii CBS 4309]